MRRKNRFLNFFLSLFLLCFILVPAEVVSPSEMTKKLESIHKEAEAEFYKTVTNILDRHFRKPELTQEDLNRISSARDGIPGLFARIINVAFQKDAPFFTALIKKGDYESVKKFRENYIALAKEYSARFVGSLFRKQPQADFTMMLPHNRGKSTLDLVLQTLGCNAKTGLPDLQKSSWFTNEIESDLYSQWGIDAVKARQCWPKTKGDGVVVAVLDSGIDPYNSLFKGKIMPGFNFIGKTTPPWSEDAPPMIDYGLHGTGVSSALLAIAPSCRIMPVRVSDSDTMNDPPYDYWLNEFAAAGIYYAVHHRAHIISVSARLLPAEPVVAEAVRYAYENNVVICSSAGNMPRPQYGLRPEEMLYRAFDKEVILIGGVEKRNEHIRAWPQSVPGDFIDVAAPSKDVFVLVPVYMQELKNQYVAGTSLSAPIAAGVVALMRSAAPPSPAILQKPGAYVRLITQSLKETACLGILRMAEPNEFVGHGLIDADAAVSKLQEKSIKLN